jgi:hypothetical protein
MEGNEFYVDGITESIIEVASGKSIDTEVKPMGLAGVRKILKKDGWKFDWKKEYRQSGRQLYKLVIVGDTIVQGLMSLQPIEKHVELHLIESAPHNYGSAKKYIGVAGNLVAFGCMISFDLGFEGFVGFRAKTRLIQHYIDTLGAELIFRDRMQISRKAAEKLVNSYYKNYFGEG